jgi:ferredoxin
MPSVIINDEAVNAAPGDNLLTLARRNGSHVWFVCDGRGLCQTCECRILSGGEQLSRPTKIELDTMSETRRKDGYRLACQTRLAASGAISLISVAEEVRRRADTLIRGAEGTTWAGNLGRLAGSLAQFALDLLRSFPSAATHAIPQMVSMPPSISGAERYFQDTKRVAGRLFGPAK